MSLSAAEQYILELINRARLDPAAEALRYGVALNAGLSAGTISTAALQVLAPNITLDASAQGHSEWMLESDTFLHTGENSSSPGDRMEDAGYDFSGAWGWRENLAWSGTTGAIDLSAAIAAHHEGLYLSAGHRANTFAADSREIGIAQVGGQFSLDGTDYNSSMLTLNFANSGSDVFVTGVAFDDRDGDAFYSIGEGEGGIWIAADGQSTTTAQAGGYGLGVTAAQDVSVQVGQGDQTLAIVELDLSVGNGKLDVMIRADGALSLLISTDATLVSGIPDATLLGIADLNLTGNGADNVLTGNSGNNRLSGGDGRGLTIGAEDANADTLIGSAGNDVLVGQAGADRLIGGSGDDILIGGSGRDTFVFVEGHDEVTDFTYNVDLIEIETDHTLAEVMAMGQIIEGNAVFDFGDGDVLTLRGLTELQGLENDLIII